MVNMFFIFILITGSYFNVFASQADQSCYDQIPEIERHFNNIKAIPGFVTGQIQIDKEARGLNRFVFNGQSVLVDAERMPVFSSKRKVFYPTENVEGKLFQGIHLSTRTNRKDHRGVEIFDLRLRANTKNTSNNKEEILFTLDHSPYYFKNYVLQTLPYERDTLEGPLWILSHGKDRNTPWSQHTFLTPKLQTLTTTSEIEIFFETDFDNTNGGEGSFILNWIENSTSGVRIDTCVYFLVS